MTTLLPNVLLGVQEPRLRNFPEGVGSDGELASELMATAGVTLDPWQDLVLDRMLRYRDDGKWACPTCLLVVPRQNGKGEVLIARMLAGLYLFEEELITYTAHLFNTAQEHFRRIAYLVEDTPALSKRVKSIHTANGKESIELKPTAARPRGQRLRFLARSEKSGRGFTGDCVILDEAYDIPELILDALIPTMSARAHMTKAGPQLWYSSSAGLETSIQLRRVREQAMSGDPHTGFAEWSAESVDDPDGLARANPGLGVRITVEHIENMEGRYTTGGYEGKNLSEAGYRRERLGIWPIGLLERVIPIEDWENVQDGEVMSGPVRFGLDILPDRSKAAVVACDGTVVEMTGSAVDGYDHRPGTSWLVPRLKTLTGKTNASVVVDGGGPAASIADELEAAGVRVERLSHAQLSAACTRIYDGIMNRTVHFVPAEPMNEAVAGLVKHETGDRWVWSRTKSQSDITPFNAATLAYGPVAPAPPVPKIQSLDDF